MADAFEAAGPGTPIVGTRYEVSGGRPLFALAPGAGAGQHSDFMVAFAKAMVARGVGVVTFDFPYRQRGARAPDRPPVLEATWDGVIRHLLAEMPQLAGRLVVGGKSMGGRIASQVLARPIADAGGTRDLRPDVAGLVLLGYPLHPPGRPDRPRVEHLRELRTSMLVVQGSRDEFGTETEVRASFAAAPALVDWLIVPDGDHSFRARKSQGGGIDRAAIYDRVAAWIVERTAGTVAGTM